MVGFVIDKEGKIRSDTIYRTIPGAETEIKRMTDLIIKKFPEWVPGTIRGRPVSVRYNLPIKLRLE